MTFEKRDIPEKLKEMRAHPIDEDYVRPVSGGCWICHTGNGWNETDEFAFSTDFDAFVHLDCLREFDVESLIEFERMLTDVC